MGLLNEGDGGAFGVDRRVVINGGAEVGNHPLVDGVFTVVGEPVGDARSGDRGAEAMGLGDGEHGHEAAVAPAGDADAVGIDGVFGQDGIDAGEDVAEVAVAEVFAVGLGEGLALAKAAAGIGHEDEVIERGEGGSAETAGAAVPAGENCGGGTAVDFDEERIFFGRIVVAGSSSQPWTSKLSFFQVRETDLPQAGWTPSLKWESWARPGDVGRDGADDGSTVRAA